MSDELNVNDQDSSAQPPLPAPKPASDKPAPKPAGDKTPEPVPAKQATDQAGKSQAENSQAEAAQKTAPAKDAAPAVEQEQAKQPAPATKPEPAKKLEAKQPERKPAGEEGNPTASKRRQKLDKARAAAVREAEHSPGRKKTGAVLLSLAAVVASAGLITAGSLLAPAANPIAMPAGVTSLPAGDAISVCAATPALLKGVDGTDPQFAPGAKEVSSNLRSAVVSDLAKRLPGSSISNVDGTGNKSLTERISDEDAAQVRSADDQGLTGRTAKVSTSNNANAQQLYTVQPLGGLPSIGSSLRSFQAKDGDLAGLAAATCQAPAANWRFTGLQTTTGSTSVLHLSNPTSTSAQVAIDLRGPEGLVDTSTLQNIVIAPGQQRAIVLGGYAQNLDSVAATVTSTGGKVSAYVQQAALRGLTPSGVELVAPNASASNTQVIPGVWIDNKDNAKKLADADKSLVPQLHVAATGSQGAGYKVKVLGTDGEVAASFESNLAAASNATSVVNLDQLAAGYYSIVVEADAPVTAAVRMVRGSNPKDPTDTAWAASAAALAGNQVMPLSANGTGKFVIAAPAADSSIDAVVVSKDGKLQKSQKLNVKAGQSLVFDPRDASEDAQAVIFSSDANAYIGQVILGSEQSIAWAGMPQANVGRDGIVVNVGG